MLHNFILAVFLLAAPAAADITWHDATSFEIEGRGWDEVEQPFLRLPEEARRGVNDTAWYMSRSSAGMAIRFVTNAETVQVRWSLTSDALDMPHMPATGVSGVDLYERHTDGQWRFVGNGRPKQQADNTAEFTFTTEGERECLLYLPLYNGTASLEVGVPAGASIESPTQPRRQPLVVYGTSIAQGGCASRPGLAWPAILGRLIDRPVINLGFSGSGTMEAPVGEVLAELQPAAFICDNIWNMGVEEDVFKQRVTQLVTDIRKTHPRTPILFVGQSMIRPEAHPTERSQWQAAAVQALQEAGVPGLSIMPGRDLLGDDGEATVDGVHMNDLGMHRQAEAMAPVVRELLKHTE